MQAQQQLITKYPALKRRDPHITLIYRLTEAELNPFSQRTFAKIREFQKQGRMQDPVEGNFQLTGSLRIHGEFIVAPLVKVPETLQNLILEVLGKPVVTSKDAARKTFAQAHITIAVRPKGFRMSVEGISFQSFSLLASELQIPFSQPTVFTLFPKAKKGSTISARRKTPHVRPKCGKKMNSGRLSSQGRQKDSCLVPKTPVFAKKSSTRKCFNRRQSGRVPSRHSTGVLGTRQVPDHEPAQQ
jgi:hypothetical protein